MNIAHLLPYSSRFPVATHNGRVEWAIRLARIQAAKGHTVTIYCAPGSGEGVTELQWRSTSHDFEKSGVNNIALIKEALQATEHDIFHSHYDYAHYLVADATMKPIIATQHWFPNDHIASAGRYNTAKNVFAVPVTEHMRRENERLGMQITETIYHGTDLSKFTYADGPREDRLVFVGRIAPHKGVREAVAIAKQAGEKLDIIGKINEKDEAYWQEILPHVDGEQIRYLGPKKVDEVVTALGRAKAFIFPTQQAEAFGQVTVEAQACGTPVIIYDLGASNELVKDGVTGFVVNTQDAFVTAIAKLPSIDHVDCRAFAEQFDLNTMVEKYEQLYQNLAV